MKVLYSIIAPIGWGDEIPQKEKVLLSFTKEAHTTDICDIEALAFFEEYIKKPENGWDYLKIERHHDQETTTIDHTGWFVKTKSTST